MESNGIAAGYVRVSTVNQVEKGDGLEIQRRKISEYCKDKGIALKTIYEDAGISGAVKDRAGLLRLLKDCEKGFIKRVIICKQDRLSRELTTAIWIETQFKKYDIELNSVIDPDYDMDDPLQKAFKRIADVFAELEKDVIAARLKDGRINNAKNGERAVGAVPFSYRLVNDKLEVNPDEARWVVKIFKWVTKGYTYTKIIGILNKRGVVTRRGNKFSIAALRYIITNQIYFGMINFDGVCSKGTHAPIISKRQFLRTQRAMQEKVAETP
ncbi:MAG: recombinase family protein [Candidatus Omnitrophica bacterium]|nr:recombinase family protein [Candidatus Omnitrophota bacterium]